MQIAPFCRLRLILALHIGAPGDSSTSPPACAVSHGRPYPLPGSANFTTATLALGGPHVAVLLHNSTNSLPELLPLAQLVYTSQDVIPEIWEEQVRIVLVVRDLLLVCQPFQHQVDESWNLGVGSTVEAVSPFAVEGGQN